MMDFNCIEVLKEKLGFKSLTAFKGTCSNLMMELWNQQIKDYIDMYYNGITSL